MSRLLFFFFQAEDGIRDVAVTGVQTCALPIYLEARVSPEVCELSAEPIDPLARGGVALDAVDADLEIGQSRAVQGFDQLRGQQVSVGDELPAPESELAHARDDADEIGVERRLATGQADDPGAQLVQLQEPPVERLEGNPSRVVVVLVAVAAAQG